MKIITTLLLVGATLFSNNKAIANENRPIMPFNRIKNSTSFNIVLEKGSKENMIIEATGVDPKKILTEVKGTTLKISMEKGNYSNTKGKITITYVNLSELSSTGSGDFSCNTDITATDFIINSSGSGNISIDGKITTTGFNFHQTGSGDVKLAKLETTDFNLSMNGSGNFTAASGHAQKQTITLAGSGNVQLFGVSGESCIVSLKGSGNVETNVSNSLQGSILGSGNVTYKVEPKVKQVQILGSGTVSKG